MKLENRMAWDAPLLYGFLQILAVFITAISTGICAEAVGMKSSMAHGLAYGIVVGRILARHHTWVRWWRIRRYRRYIEGQARKTPPRTQPWDGRLSPNQIHAGSPTDLAFDTEGGVINLKTGERVTTKSYQEATCGDCNRLVSVCRCLSIAHDKR